MSRAAPAPQPTIVVIGGGFSGTAVAVNLLRRRRPARALLVNRYGPIVRGVAYGTRLEAHVLNVPAGGMSALENENPRQPSMSLAVGSPEPLRDPSRRWARAGGFSLSPPGSRPPTRPPKANPRQ